MFDRGLAVGRACLDTDAATSIGMLANGFPDSVEFLNELGVALQRLRPGIALHDYNKGNASIAANEQLLGEIGGDCVGVISAYGH